MWQEALKVFVFGFGGVFLALAFLMIFVQISGAVIKRLEARGVKKEARNA
ncbi:MAG TPA: OadG family transporter subunit [Syntrophales bacterium]|nr:OadG family transporter subunit [Syntrophales bacterium]HOM07421.1 OadG family transporter subunit [Syntrophales bacterium]HON99993.1 OadG family transporter subunit [Syntrophales bacterium]HPC01513.1 OadG family transporter subunit [Syntrophales bacterium]HPQ07062.1 OadG family transporter subunit [Syntrophales bacterium]